MPRNSRVNALREIAIKMERNAGKKMSRLRNSDNAVELAGSSFDVRKGVGSVSKMRARDLEVHIRRLGEFNSRKARFMATDTGPAGPEVVNRFLKAQGGLNRQRKAMMDKYGDIKAPDSDENIRQKWAVRDVAQRRMSDPSVNNPFREVDKLGIKYRTPEAIMKMTAKFEKEQTPEWKDETRAAHRETFDKMMEKVDMPDLAAMVRQMTDSQFDAMWNNPDFMTGQGFIYGQVTGRDREDMDADQIEAMDDSVENEAYESMGIAIWALQF